MSNEKSSDDLLDSLQESMDSENHIRQVVSEVEDEHIAKGNYQPIKVIDYDIVEKAYSARIQRWCKLTNGQWFMLVDTETANTVKGRKVFKAMSYPSVVYMEHKDGLIPCVKTKLVGYFNENTNEFIEVTDDDLNEDKSESYRC